MLLQLDELDDRAKVIAEMQISGRLDAGKYQLLEGHYRLDGGRRAISKSGFRFCVRSRAN
jgi:hypothetical protein